MRLVHVTSSRFFGGPERQMLELARTLAGRCDSRFVSFSEGGRCREFLDRVKADGFRAAELRRDTPRLAGALRDLCALVGDWSPDLVVTHGYKANLLGLLAARRHRVPIASVSRGWTAESWRVAQYERLDRWVLRRMDRVVCVAHAQARRVLAAGVAGDRVRMIHNAIRPERFLNAASEYACRLRSLFPDRPAIVAGAAGRLSPEKGFDVLIDAAAQVVRRRDQVGFILFGEGACRRQLVAQARVQGLASRFVLAGFTPDLDCLLPYLDLCVIPSRTEGLSNVALEASVARVPIVATDVGGNAEVVLDGVTGYVVPPDDATALAERIVQLVDAPARRTAMGRAASEYVQQTFSFEHQARQYEQLAAELLSECGTTPTPQNAGLASSPWKPHRI